MTMKVLDVLVVTHNKNILKLFATFTILALVAYIIAIFLGLGILKEKMFYEKKKEIKNIVDTMYSVIQYIDKKNIPESQKKQEIINLIKNVRFEKNNYFWLFTNSNPPIMIMHPYLPSLNGKPLLDTKFNCASMMEYNHKEYKLENKNLFVAMLEILKHSNEGYVLYKWPKPLKNGISKKAYEKLSFIKLIPKYNWVIGSGIYIDDIEKEYYNVISKYLIVSIIISVVMLILIALIFKKLLLIQKDLRIKQAKIENLAYHDPLTNFLNRTGFYQKFEKALEKNEKFNIIFLDLNNFKQVNDTYGHEVGDKLLEEVAKRIKNSISETISRLGGDEFVILTTKDPKKIINKLQKEISKPYYINGIEIKNISASFGISKYPEDGLNRFELLKTADLRMYKNKNKSKENNESDIITFYNS